MKKKSINVYCTDKQKKKIKVMAENKGQSVSSYLLIKGLKK